MEHGVHDLARHNAWANAELLAHCRSLEPAALELTAPGTYGTILATLRHLIDAEASYVTRLTGAWPAHPWRGGSGSPEVGLDVLAERAALLGELLERFLAGPWDSEGLGEAGGPGGTTFDVRAGVFLTQLLHHGNEHRAHVCTILGAHGFEPPDLSAWSYALATGRSTPRA